VSFREQIAGGFADFRHLVVQNHSALDGSLDRRPNYLPDHGSTMGLSKTTQMPTTTPVTGLALKRSSTEATSISPRRDDNHAPATAIFSEAQTTPRRR
jgi:hypothetical protein